MYVPAFSPKAQGKSCTLGALYAGPAFVYSLLPCLCSTDRECLSGPDWQGIFMRADSTAEPDP